MPEGLNGRSNAGTPPPDGRHEEANRTMAVTHPIDLDLDRIDALIAEEEAALEPKHRASLGFRATAERSVAGGVASSWQDSPPHAIYVDHGQGSRLWDIDGNEYVDFHLGYGAMVMGHAHPKIVEAIRRQAGLGTHFAQPTKHLAAVGENLVDRFGLPLWRFCNSGTEATLEAARLMRANTGREIILKIEGTYHGHHDALMFSVAPDPELIGPREHPVTVPQAEGIPQAFADLVRVVPFNDLAEVERALAEHEGNVAGMIVEPAMMNCGVIFPEPGYLQGLKDLMHANGAYLAFDEVKTGITLAYGGASEVFGVTPDIICLAKAIGGGLPCGAIGATRELFQPVVDGVYDIAGTYNGNPLTMAASEVCLTEVMTRDVYDHLNEIHRILVDGCTAAIDAHRLPAHVTGVGAKGSVIYSATPVREYRDAVGIDERITYLAWLVQQNRGVFKSPWSKQETWTTAITHSEDDARRYVANFEELAAMLAA
jgi:glutamate-1-semialdehyde 2,1-aminomutase